jgi:hypothetical protein
MGNGFPRKEKASCKDQAFPSRRVVDFTSPTATMKYK